MAAGVQRLSELRDFIDLCGCALRAFGAWQPELLGAVEIQSQSQAAGGGGGEASQASEPKKEKNEKKKKVKKDKKDKTDKKTM